ncbi:MAG: NUDIX domain-containing protein [Bacteroidales bacterium]|mgnify:CR=1 FL=1|nr:NUDIX domain-containing protein [Bacteroidales bacterium]
MPHPLDKFTFCPKCGSSHFIINNEKSKKCIDCGFVYYFNSSASTVGIIINEKEELLVARRAKEPAKGTFDLPGGFVDLNETGEEAILREIKEESQLIVSRAFYQFSIPNTYEYSNFLVHTLDLFYYCEVEDYSTLKALDDVESLHFIPFKELKVEDFGLHSIQQGIKILKDRALQKKKLFHLY